MRHLDSQIEPLRRNAGQLEQIEQAGGMWADDASVLRGFLYTATAGDILWAPEASLDHYRLLTHFPHGIHLDSWTEEQLKSIPWIAAIWLDENISQNERVADFFARQLISNVLVVGGSEKAGDELSLLQASHRVPESTIRELSVMITLSRKELHSHSLQGSDSPTPPGSIP